MDNLLKNIQRLYGLTANEAYQAICFFQSVNHSEVKTLLQTKVLDQIRQDYFPEWGLMLTYNHEGYVNAIYIDLQEEQMGVNTQENSLLRLNHSQLLQHYRQLKLPVLNLHNTLLSVKEGLCFYFKQQTLIGFSFSRLPKSVCTD